MQPARCYLMLYGLRDGARRPEVFALRAGKCRRVPLQFFAAGHSCAAALLSYSMIPGRNFHVTYMIFEWKYRHSNYYEFLIDVTPPRELEKFESDRNCSVKYNGDRRASCLSVYFDMPLRVQRMSFSFPKRSHLKTLAQIISFGKLSLAFTLRPLGYRRHASVDRSVRSLARRGSTAQSSILSHSPIPHYANHAAARVKFSL